jgi:Terminase large subunit, T4likevirus-type, N-terminal
MIGLDLLNAVDPVGWVRRVLGFEPDAKQQLVLASVHKRMLLNCSRQWGKSTVTAAKAVHRALEFPDKLIIAMSPSARQTGELMRKIEEFLRHCSIKLKGDGNNEMSILLPNGSRIVGLPGGEGTIRGFSRVNLLIVDEAARVPDESYRAARPMLAVANGDLVLLSTPYGKRGFFYEEWIGESDWLRVTVPAADCPRIPPDFLADERRSLGDLWFRQEYCCEFIDNETQLFSRDTITNALDKEIEPLF